MAAKSANNLVTVYHPLTILTEQAKIGGTCASARRFYTYRCEY